MTVYNISAMADRIQYLQSQGQEGQQARENVMKEFRVNAIPQEVEEKLQHYISNPTQDSKFARNDKESLVNRNETTTTFDLGSEQGQTQQPQQEMDSPESDSF